MAKSDPRKPDDALDAAEVQKTADAEEVVEEAVEEVEEPVEEVVEEPVEAAVEEAVEEPEERPRPAISTVNLVLFIVNLLVALGVVYLLVLDYARRHAWANANFLHDVALQGVPLDDKDNLGAASGESGWALPLEPDWLKSAANARGVRGVTEPFQRVNELTTQRVNPVHLGPDTLKHIFKELNAGQPIESLAKELKALSGKLPKDIDDAAAKVAEKVKTDDDKRKRLRELLMPLAHTTDQVEELEAALKNIKPNQLDAALLEAAKRRLYADILVPLEIRRSLESEEPAEKEKDRPLDIVVKVTKGKFDVSLETLQELLTKRMEGALAEAGIRDTVERRRIIAFLLFTVSQAKGPDGEPLYNRDRVEVLVGLQQLIQAADTYAVVLRTLELRHHTAVARDRGYYIYPLEQRLYDDNIDTFIASLGQLITSKDKGFDTTIQNTKQFNTQLKQLLLQQPGDKRNGPDVLKLVKGLMAKQGIVIAEDPRDMGFKVRETAFDREVLRLLDSRAPGFIGEHKELVERMQLFAAEIKDRDNQLQTLTRQRDERAQHHKLRTEHAGAVKDKLIAARAQTKRLAGELRVLQEQLFRAQVELSDVEQRNLALAERLRLLELKRGGRTP